MQTRAAAVGLILGLAFLGALLPSHGQQSEKADPVGCLTIAPFHAADTSDASLNKWGWSEFLDPR